MNDGIKECFKLMKSYRKKLTIQQKRTFKGQILSGDYKGFREGLFNVVKRKYIGEVK